MTVFHIELSPQRRDDLLQMEKRGATLILNGEIFDPTKFDGSNAQSQWIVGAPKAVEDGWSVKVILPHGSPAPHATRFPDPVVATTDGPINLPPYEGPDEDEAELCAAVAAKLSAHANRDVTENDHEIRIPKRLRLGELPAGVYFIEASSPFAKYPEFGAVIAHVIGTASLLELEMWRPGVSQFGSESLLAIRTAFAALENDDRRRRYIKSIAENTGRELVWKTIAWAYEYSKPVFEIRNKFAHHIWGKCPAIPNALLLADPMDRLTGHAALSQLLGHQAAKKEAQILMRMAAGDGGSSLSESDTKAVFEMAMARQNQPSRIEAFRLTFDNPSDFRAPSAEVWTTGDFRNAAMAANLAQIHVIGRLQKLSQWLHGLRQESELEPLPEKPSKKRPPKYR